MDNSSYRKDLYSASVDICGRFSENILFQKGNTRITFSETLSSIRKRGAFIAEKGYGKGDVIAILAENSPDWCITFLAACSAGCTALPLDTNLQKESYPEMLRAVNARAVFVSEKFLELPGNVPVHGIRTILVNRAFVYFDRKLVSHVKL